MEESDLNLDHLLDEEDLASEIKKKQNEFLDLYSLYLDTKITAIKDELILKAYQLHILDPNFILYI